MDKLIVELQDGYLVEIDPLNHTLRQRYTGQDKDGNEKESIRTIGYFGDMKQCVKTMLERYPRELSEKAQISFNEYLELLDKAYTRSEQLVNSLGEGRRLKCTETERNAAGLSQRWQIGRQEYQNIRIRMP